MPPIRSITCADNTLTFVDHRGVTKTLLASQIPPQQDNIEKIETFVNTVWIPANVVGYQMRIHVFSMNPLKFTIGTWNLGLTIPENWWVVPTVQVP